MPAPAWASPPCDVAPHAGAWIEIYRSTRTTHIAMVAPHAGAWIEIVGRRLKKIKRFVAPHAGAWIEILRCSLKYSAMLSHPTRVRGLKYGAKLDIRHTGHASHPTRVRGLKLFWRGLAALCALSHPTRVRGLKSIFAICLVVEHVVAPHAGAWIEMSDFVLVFISVQRRTPRGCVD